MIISILRDLLIDKYPDSELKYIKYNSEFLDIDYRISSLFTKISEDVSIKERKTRHFFWCDNPDLYYEDRNRYGGAENTEDLFVRYVSFLIEDYFKVSEQSLIKGIRREYAKIFLDNNRVKKIKICSLMDRAGIIYKILAKDFQIEVIKDCCEKNEIVFLIEKNENIFKQVLRIDDFFYVLFYFSVMNKAWRAKYYESTECVLIEENLFDEIRLLDEGATSIIYTTADGKLTGSKYLSDYIAQFPGMVPVHRTYIEKMSEDEMIEYAMFKMQKYYNEMIPCLEDDRVVGYVKKRDEKRFHVDLCWNLIDEETVQESLKNYEYIFLSSLGGELKNLYEKIKKIKKVRILDESNYDELLNGKVDLLITNSNIWNNFPIDSVNVKHLYINLYCMQMKSFFDGKDVNYSFYSIPDSERVVNHSKRVAIESKQHVNNIMSDGGTFTVADGVVDDCEYFHGRRRTTDVPMIWDGTIYFYGPCISIGVFAYDSETIESFLQRKLNNAGIRYRVVNVPAPLLLNPYDSAINTIHKIGQGKYRKGDIIVHFGRNNLEWHGIIKENQEKHDLSDVFNTKENVTKKCFIGNMAAHVNADGYELVADYIFEELKQYRHTKRQKSEFCQFHADDFEKMRPELVKYINFLHKNAFENVEDKTVGAVAVNANPFTLGHAHLIDEARKRADYLYVFVAEEDLSDFSFEVRYELVKKYCEEYSNVKVIPSGRFFASTLSFGDYFNRDALSEVQIDATLDCNIFAKVIAKELKIEFRVMGEEKHDFVTNQYNQFVKEILEQNGVKVIVIPRLEINGNPVSAKRVRKHIMNREMDLLKEEVPITTYEYIMNQMV